MAIEEASALMFQYKEYARSPKDKVFTADVREELRVRAENIRGTQKGLESGFYED